MAQKTICDYLKCHNEANTIRLNEFGDYYQRKIAEEDSGYQDISIDLCFEHQGEFLRHILFYCARSDKNKIELELDAVKRWLKAFKKE